MKGHETLKPDEEEAHSPVLLPADELIHASPITPATVHPDIPAPGIHPSIALRSTKGYLRVKSIFPWPDLLEKKIQLLPADTQLTFGPLGPEVLKFREELDPLQDELMEELAAMKAQGITKLIAPKSLWKYQIKIHMTYVKERALRVTNPRVGTDGVPLARVKSQLELYLEGLVRPMYGQKPSDAHIRP